MVFLNLSGAGDYAVLTLRIVLAIIFLVHGYGKLKPSKGKKDSMSNFMLFIGAAEVLGALAIASGFLFDWAVLGLGIIMFGATLMKVFKWKSPFTSMTATGWEFDLLILASLKVLFLAGAGTYVLF